MCKTESLQRSLYSQRLPQRSTCVKRGPFFRHSKARLAVMPLYHVYSDDTLTEDNTFGLINGRVSKDSQTIITMGCLFDQWKSL